MQNPKQALKHLREALATEKQEEIRRYREKVLKQNADQRRKEGVTWYPVVLQDEEVGLGGRLIVEFSRNAEGPHLFSSGSVAALWVNRAGKRSKEELIGVVVKAGRQSMRLALDTDELPEWLVDGKLGIDLYFDERSYREMDKAVERVQNAANNRLSDLREVLYGKYSPSFDTPRPDPELPGLNASQQKALGIVSRALDVALIHGPPGTGKTTTLVAAISQTLKSEKQVLVCAPSNLATDLLTEKLAAQGVKVLRLGHPARLTDAVVKHCLDAQFEAHARYPEMKKLRKDANTKLREAKKWKRSFGREERAKRGELFKEMGQLKKEARDMEGFITRDLINHAQVIACTLVGAAGDLLSRKKFRTVFIDEAGQAMEPATWIPIGLGQRVVFAGDHFQLPPTVKSREAAAEGLSVSLFEKVMKLEDASVMLDRQYRMHREIMGFSNAHFYNTALQADDSVAEARLGEGDWAAPLEFIDTAGCGFEEKRHPESQSLFNLEEGRLLLRHLGALLSQLPEPEEGQRVGVISPYKAQVNELRDMLPGSELPEAWMPVVSVDTVDGFQGQEREIIYISMVRSNNEGQLGFLSDTRRMNVALTRARKKLVVIGDSATLANHSFYQEFLDYVEEIGAYRSAWEWMS